MDLAVMLCPVPVVLQVLQDCFAPICIAARWRAATGAFASARVLATPSNDAWKNGSNLRILRLLEIHSQPCNSSRQARTELTLLADKVLMHTLHLPLATLIHFLMGVAQPFHGSI